MKVFTLGTSNRSLKEFFEILNFYKIKRVIDIRHFPTSKLFPHFKKENLEKFLKENKIDYFHLKKLGGYRKGGYKEYIKTEDFKKGLENLIKFVKKEKTAMICAEKFPWKCHRVFVSRELEKRGFEIVHIIEKGRIWSPKEDPKEIRPVCQKAKFLKK